MLETATRPTMRQLARGVADPTTAMLERCGFFRLCFARRKALRILCYHGVCSDEAAADPATPSYFVPVSLFARQMRMLATYGRIAHLPEEADRIHHGHDCTESAFAVTFDDVAACTHRYALPVLDQFGIRASFFVSTAYASSGRLFDFDVLRLLRLHPECSRQIASLRALAANTSAYRRTPMDGLRRELDRAEAALREVMDAEVIEMLRPMNWSEIRELTAKGHDIGGHTADHAVLGAYDHDTRAQQIESCARDIERELGIKPAGFAFPIGGPQDFSRADCDAVRRAGFRYAVSMRPGFCAAGDNPYALPRIGIAAGHTPARFAREISGVLDNQRCQEQGWNSITVESTQLVRGRTVCNVEDAREPASMREEEYQVLRNLLARNKPQKTLEIGMATGGSTELFCRHLRDANGVSHTAVDPHQFDPNVWDGRGADRVREAGAGDYLRVITEPDYIALPRLHASGERFDFVLIDGWHSFDFTLLDIFYADLLLRSGGMLVIHDTNWPAVYKACRFLETHKPYKRVGPRIFVRREWFTARLARRLGQLTGLTATPTEARQRRRQWFALAAYRKLESRQVPNDFFAHF